LAVLHSTDVPVDTFGSRSLAFAGYTTKHRLSSFDRPRSFDPYSDSYSTSVHIVYTVYTYICVCVCVCVFRLYREQDRHKVKLDHHTQSNPPPPL
jgi:hypothetical protein